jgi:AraC-like DNA-binding protein
MTQTNSPISLLVPQQPDLYSITNDILEVIKVWNPVCIKNLASYCQFKTGSEGGSVKIFPDACFNFVFVCNDNPRAYLLGPHFSLLEVKLVPKSTYFIVKPFSLLCVNYIKLPIKDLVNERVPLELLFHDTSIIEQINSAYDFPSQIKLFNDYAQKHLIKPPGFANNFVEHLELTICRHLGRDRINKLAEIVGFTPTYCRRKFKDSLGMTLKTYSNVIRIQNAIRMMMACRAPDIFDIVLENNLCDQAHLINIFKNFTRHTPKEFIRHYGYLSACAKGCMSKL